MTATPDPIGLLRSIRLKHGRTKHMTWIPVKLRVPNDAVPVLVAFHYHHAGKCKYAVTEAAHGDQEWWMSQCYDNPLKLENVTHWMPLPAHPECGGMVERDL